VSDQVGRECVEGQFPDPDPVGASKDTADEAPAWPAPTNPLAVAWHLVKQNGLSDHDGVLRARWWRGSHYQHRGTHWAETADPTVRAWLYLTLGRARYLKGDEPIPWEPTRRKVGDVMEALQAVTHLSEYTDPPAWVGGPDGGRVLAVRNGLLDLDARTLAERTPRLFNLMALPYDYQPDAPEPAGWLRFLEELWPDDPASVDLLQEVFGYVLSGETNQQKILLLVGPARSGKGTIARVLTALVGEDNAVGPTLASLGTNFGLQPLLGKTLAVISDARLGGNTNAVVERLLSISGEDGITVDRKYKAPWTGRVPVRFAILSNELPNLGDASGAVATRFVVLTLVRSWLGNENPGLTEELLTELPGILRWSLDGLDRLRKQGHFTEPASSRDAVMALADLTSPVGAFVREACERAPGLLVACRELYRAWRQWSQDHGRDRPTTEQVFGRDLRAVIPGLKGVRPRDGEQRHRSYEGIALNAAYAAYMGWTRNAGTADHRGPEADDEDAVRDGPRSHPLWSPPGAASDSSDPSDPSDPGQSASRPRRWRCGTCRHETSTTSVDMDGTPCVNRAGGCTGRYQEATR